MKVDDIYLKFKNHRTQSGGFLCLKHVVNEYFTTDFNHLNGAENRSELFSLPLDGNT